MFKNTVYAVYVPKSYNNETRTILVTTEKFDDGPGIVVSVQDFGFKSAFDVCDILREYTRCAREDFVYGGLVTSMRALKTKYKDSKILKDFAIK